MTTPRTARSRLSAMIAFPLTLGLSAALSACTTPAAEGEDQVAVEDPQTSIQPAPQETTQVEAASSMTPADLILAAESTPAGFHYEDFYAIFGSSPTAEDNLNPDIVSPPECAPLVFDTSSLIEWGAEPRDTTAVSFYTGDNDALILIKLTTADPNTSGPIDAATCAEATRENHNELVSILTTYAINPLEVNLAGADTVTAIDLTVSGLSLDGEPFEAEKIGDTTQVISTIVDDVALTMVSTGPVDTQILTDLAATQIEALRAADEQ